MATNDEGFRIEITTRYLPEHSDADEPRFMFAYHVSIHNDGDAPAQLLMRHWVISDAKGGIEEVRGPGVIGQQPRIKPGEKHEYQSYSPLKTPRGTMHGSFQMVRDDGTAFDVEIPTFVLAMPELSNQMLN